MVQKHDFTHFRKLFYYSLGSSSVVKKVLDERASRYLSFALNNTMDNTKPFHANVSSLKYFKPLFF